MADPRKRLSTNVSGEFYVDSTCINCDTCRQLAPSVFGEADGYSMVENQPGSTAENRDALRALLCCPTGSIGTQGANFAKEVIEDFPLPLEGDVFYTGFNSAKSYGGNSYFVSDSGGNWLIDSPKYLPQLIASIEKMGGLKYIFLTHRDDVADAKKFAEHFGATRIIHRRDASSQPDAEMIIDGVDVVEVTDRFKIIPSPGHTAGHCLLLVDNKYLFTGDHMAWERDDNRLDAWPDYAWFSWEEQKKSIVRLRDFDFEWVLPGHGQRVNLPAEAMRAKLEELIALIKT
jgi:glyoxylase-like metal-dependent hydrolase (beta-lactamase superfamily II)/ferredoxin